MFDGDLRPTQPTSNETEYTRDPEHPDLHPTRRDATATTDSTHIGPDSTRPLALNRSAAQATKKRAPRPHTARGAHLHNNKETSRPHTGAPQPQHATATPPARRAVRPVDSQTGAKRTHGGASARKRVRSAYSEPEKTARANKKTRPHKRANKKTRPHKRARTKRHGARGTRNKPQPTRPTRPHTRHTQHRARKAR